MAALGDGVGVGVGVGVGGWLFTVVAVRERTPGVPTQCRLVTGRRAIHIHIHTHTCIHINTHRPAAVAPGCPHQIGNMGGGRPGRSGTGTRERTEGGGEADKKVG